MTLIGIGMFFDGFDIYIAATVLGATLHSGFSTLAQNAMFVSATFVGMISVPSSPASLVTATAAALPTSSTCFWSAAHPYSPRSRPT